MESFLDHRLQSGVEKALHQRVGGVVAAGRLAFVARRGMETERGAVRGELRDELEQRFVDAAELFGAKVAVVHRSAPVPFGEECEGVYG